MTRRGKGVILLFEPVVPFAILFSKRRMSLFPLVAKVKTIDGQG